MTRHRCDIFSTAAVVPRRNDREISPKLTIRFGVNATASVMKGLILFRFENILCPLLKV